MKRLIALTFSFLVLSVTASADVRENVKEGVLETGLLNHYLASPKFGAALAEATQSTNGWKIRIGYKTDNTSRTTVEQVNVTVAGMVSQSGGLSKYYQSEFTVRGINGGWNITATPVKTSEITSQEFSAFKE